MIRINLLPEEFKRTTTVPPRSLALLVGASLAGFGALSVLGYLFFNVRASVAAEVQIAQEQLANLRPRAQYADALAKEKTDFEKRHQTIQEIASSRILWTRKMDRLSAVVNEDRSTGRHQVWLDSLEVGSTSGNRAGGIKMRGHSAGDKSVNVSNFHEDLQADPLFAEGFVLFTPPSFKRGGEDETLEPSEMFDFDFEVKLPEPETKRRAPAPPPAPKK